MNLPFDSSMIIDINRKRWLLQGKKLSRLPDKISTDNDIIAGPQIHVTDFGNALHGVEQISSPKRFAAAIIDKNLRDRGEAEGTSHVLLINTCRSAGAMRALYSAVPSDTYEKYTGMAHKHNDHVLLIPHLALLQARGSKAGDNPVCVLFQNDLNIDLLLLIGGNTLATARVTSAGRSDTEWQRALRYLIDELSAMKARLDLNVDDAVWVSWDPDQMGQEDDLCSWIEEHAGLNVLRSPNTQMNVEGKTVCSSLPSLFSLYHGALAANKIPSLPLYWAERALPIAATLVAAISFALIALGTQWQAQARQQEATFLTLANESQQLDPAQIRADINQAIANNVRPDDIAFVELVHAANSQPTLATLLSDIRDAVPDNIYLTDLRLLDQRRSRQLRIDGWIDADMAGVNTMMETLIGALTARGYQVSANNLRGQRRRNLFQLELNLDNNHREI